MRTLTVLAFTALAMAAHADITSTFDVDNEGWSAADVNPLTLATVQSQAATWNAGRIEATEFGSGLFVLAAPAKFLGDQSAYYGGSVTYRLSDAVRDGSSYINLLLRGNGVAIAYTTPPPDALGTDYSIPLTATGWIGFDGKPVTDAQFRSVLSNLDRFGVNADWRTQGQDVVSLDNVRVAAVPEPATLAAVGIGLGATIRRRKRR